MRYLMLFYLSLSIFGQMFASSHPQIALKEMLRVTKPGGRIAFSTWPAKLVNGKLFDVMAKYLLQSSSFSSCIVGIISIWEADHEQMVGPKKVFMHAFLSTHIVYNKRPSTDYINSGFCTCRNDLPDSCNNGKSTWDDQKLGLGLRKISVEVLYGTFARGTICNTSYCK